jgi:hypothetical protein
LPEPFSESLSAWESGQGKRLSEIDGKFSCRERRSETLREVQRISPHQSRAKLEENSTMKRFAMIAVTLTVFTVLVPGVQAAGKEAAAVTKPKRVTIFSRLLELERRKNAYIRRMLGWEAKQKSSQ